jgi:hypothetical protein
MHIIKHTEINVPEEEVELMMIMMYWLCYLKNELDVSPESRNVKSKFLLFDFLVNDLL